MAQFSGSSSAIACFDRSLDAIVADEPLKADARHNLELAKLLWAEANKKAAKPDSPNMPTREDEQPEPSTAPQSGSDPGSNNDNGADANPGKTETRPVSTPKTELAPKNDQNGVMNPIANGRSDTTRPWSNCSGCSCRVSWPG